MGTDIENTPRIEQLFHAALEMAPAERAAYLARECASEELIRAEVESLVKVFEERADFLEQPAFDKGLEVLATNSAKSLLGKVIGPYRLRHLLGKGGMGEVYLAEDTRLSRLVALKFLAPHLTTDTWAKRQLVKEAQAVARLNHPNICTVYGLEEVDGHSFIVMQYLEGELLADLIHEGQVGAEQALPLARQMASALAEAHAHGIIHRDIKPRNLILTRGAQLKVLDFGLAKVIQGEQKMGGALDAPSQASQTGLIMGTVPYMSPEQLRGERLDFRSDIFSVGLVLYELANGRHPFARGNDAETIAAILTGSPERGSDIAANGLECIIRKCLEKDKERRYQSADELLLELQNHQAKAAPRWSRPRLNPMVTVSLLVLLLAGALFAFLRLTAIPTLAVLPFANEAAGSQLDYLVAGLPESVANQLARLSRVKIKAPTTVFDGKDQPADPLSAGRAIGADALLVGTASAQGQAFTLQLRLLKTADGSQLWAKNYDLKQTDALLLQELVANEVVASLRLQLTQKETESLRVRPTAKTEAFHKYLQGRYYWRWRDRENIQLAIDSFKDATILDPTYARAYTGLADSYVLRNTVAYGEKPTREAMMDALAAAAQALALDNTLPEAHTSLGVIKLKYNWDWSGAEADFRQAIHLNPDYASAHYWYSHLLMITGRTTEGLAETAVARELDPLSPAMNLNHCRSMFWLRQYDRAANCFNEMLLKTPANEHAQYVLALVYQEQGYFEKAVALLEKLYERRESYAAAALGHAYGKMGRKEDALRVLARIEEMAKQTYVPPLEMAIIHVGLGDREQAFAWLEKAREEHSASLIYLTVEPLFDRLRPDSRFADLARGLQLLPQTL
jgi:serine/threonine protein kinase/Flp pilus assembly protein TadD